MTRPPRRLRPDRAKRYRIRPPHDRHAASGIQSPAQSPMTQQDHIPAIPPRFWWLKRLLPAGIALSASLVLVNLGLDSVAERRIDEAIARVRASDVMNPPATPEPGPIANEENGAVLLRQAARGLNLNTDEQQLLREISRNDFTRQRFAALDRLTQRYGRELSLLDKALASRASYTSLPQAQLSTLLNAWSGGWIINCQAIRKREEGDITGALADAYKLTRLSVMHHSDPDLALWQPFDPLLQMAEQQTRAALEDSELLATDSDSDALALRAAILEGLRADFINASHRIPKLKRAAIASLIYWVDRIRGQAANAAGIPARIKSIPWGLRPLCKIGVEAEFNERAGQLMRLPEQIESESPKARPGRLAVWAYYIRPPHYRSPLRRERVNDHLVRTRALSTAIALRLYHFDHDQFPLTLTQLIPNYLPAIPLDPHAESATALRYLADQHSALIYSVGTDRRDDSGSVDILDGVGNPIRGRGDLSVCVRAKRANATTPREKE